MPRDLVNDFIISIDVIYETNVKSLGNRTCIRNLFEFQLWKLIFFLFKSAISTTYVKIIIIIKGKQENRLTIIRIFFVLRRQWRQKGKWNNLLAIMENIPVNIGSSSNIHSVRRRLNFFFLFLIIINAGWCFNIKF